MPLKNGLTIDPPDVNSAPGRFQPSTRAHPLRAGAVKGTGAGAIANIVAARAARGRSGTSPISAGASTGAS
jgi:DNA polymerase III alpha subunit